MEAMPAASLDQNTKQAIRILYCCRQSVRSSMAEDSGEGRSSKNAPCGRSVMMSNMLELLKLKT
jgi:hypothetical protein